MKYKECGSFASFVSSGKPVFDIEYTTALAFCTKLPKGDFGIAKHLRSMRGSAAVLDGEVPRSRSCRTICAWRVDRCRRRAR